MTEETKRSWREWLRTRFERPEIGGLSFDETRRRPDGPVVPGGSVMTQPGPLPGSAPGSVSEHMHEYLLDETTPRAADLEPPTSPGPLLDTDLWDRSIEKQIEDRCPECGGSGLDTVAAFAGIPETCQACKGLGRRITRHYRP